MDWNKAWPEWEERAGGGRKESSVPDRERAGRGEEGGERTEEEQQLHHHFILSLPPGLPSLYISSRSVLSTTHHGSIVFQNYAGKAGTSQEGVGFRRDLAPC